MGAILCLYCCFKNIATRKFEISLIVFNSISTVFLILCFGIFSWSKIPKVNLVFFILMLLINLCCLTFAILLRYWRAKEVIKTTRKKNGVTISMIGFIFSIIFFIICIIEEYCLIIGFRMVDYPCGSNGSRDYNRYYCYGWEFYTHEIKDSEYIMAYLTFSYLEIALILGIGIWYFLKVRIVQGLDGPAPIQPVQGVMYDQYGRQVVVVQPGDVVMMGGQRHVAVNQPQYNAQYQNQYNNYQQNYYPNNYPYNNNINNNMMEKPNPGSNDYIQGNPQ